MNQPKLSAKYKLEAYNQRDVVSLTPLSKWTIKEEDIQKKHNRIVQPGFMYRDSSLVVADAKRSGVEWLTDVVCPSAQAAIMLHIAKEMVVNYQVGETELNIKGHEVYASLVNDLFTFKGIEEEANRKTRAFSDDATTIETAAREMLKKNLRIDDKAINSVQLAAAKRLILDIERRKIIDNIVSKLVKNHLEAHSLQLGLVKKTRHPIGTTHDFCFLGAAGSGKSTISQQHVSDGPYTGPEPLKIDKRDCIILATDNYRVFTLPGTEAHESIETKDVFTRTQDFSYLVKELVQKEIEQGMDEDQRRPNVICDCVTLDGPMRELIAQNDPKKGGSLVSVIAAYRGEPGYVGIAERADKRARDLDAAPADKGRFVETTSLFKGHVNASEYLLSSIPENTVTELFDTHVEKGETPVKIARIDSKNRTVEITNLKVMSEFLNKKNLNVEAQHPVELILKRKAGTEKPFVTAPEYKAKALLDMVTGNPSYSVIIKDNKGTAYASLTLNDLGKVTLQVLDLSVYKKQADRESSPEAQVVREITRQTAEATAAVSASPEAEALALCKTIEKRIADSETAMRADAGRIAIEKNVQREGLEPQVQKFNEGKTVIQQDFIEKLIKLHQKMIELTYKSHTKLNESEALYKKLFATQEKLFKQITYDSTLPQIIKSFKQFSLHCLIHAKKADSIMGHRWLFKAVEAVGKLLAAFLVGIGSLFQQGFAKESHMYREKFFTTYQTEASKAVQTFKETLSHLKTDVESLNTSNSKSNRMS